jgi:hypothetical protein
MIEESSYLSSILGPGALRLRVSQESERVIGTLEQRESVFPLMDVMEDDQRNLHLSVTQAHCAGHFAGPTTLPGYRMLELGAMLGEGKLVRQISNAVFNKIITPRDEIIATPKDTSGFTLTRNGAPVAEADVDYDHVGFTPHQMGILLEISAQTIITNMIKQKGEVRELYFPLIRSVGDIKMLQPDFIGTLTVTPSELSKLDRRDKFSGSTIVQNEKGDTIAAINDIDFLFANAGSIEIYTRFGRNNQ